MNLRKKISPNDLYTEYVAILNGVLRLSKRVGEVLVLLLSIGVDVPLTESRRIIAQALGITQTTLSRHFRPLKDKGILIKLGNKWQLNPAIAPDVNRGEVSINFILELSDDRTNEGNKV